MAHDASILNKIADYLARRDYSVKEIEEKLAQKKNYDPDKIKEALEKAIQDKWFLPEDELAEKVANSLAQKNKSYYFISNYLKEKGLPEVTFSEDLEAKAISRCLTKKFGRYSALSPEDKQKAMRLLSSRGFQKEICYKVLDLNYEID